jgi:hypothetical protein
MVVSVLFDLDSSSDFGNSATRVSVMPRSARRTASLCKTPHLESRCQTSLLPGAESWRP